ncbi:MAG: gliding motility-associated C-terminal domain-containing protein [Bacteroidia bacterium]|nr:gliding motility-associated C-terminal domain-containing protein [Bacteroidia bacterium]
MLRDIPLPHQFVINWQTNHSSWKGCILDIHRLKMPKGLFAILLFTLTIQMGVAQSYDNVWFLGESLLLDFSTAPPKVSFDAGALNSFEGVASMCDSVGQLLFYCDGGRLFNKAHKFFSGWQVMTKWYSSAAITQGLTALPGHESMYFLLQLTEDQQATNPLQLYLTVIDMKKNNGEGEVIITDSLIGTLFSEQLTAIRHPNGMAWWVIGHKNKDDTFILYSLDITGVSSRIEQKVGRNHELFPSYPYSFGEMTTNNEGSIIATISGVGKVDLLSFDRCHGLLTEFAEIDRGLGNEGFLYGLSFSPNGKYLYAGEGFGTSPDRLLQYEVKSGNITGSEIIVWETPLDSINKYETFGQLELGPDGKIYVVHYDQDNHDAQTKLGVIHNPNEKGLACNFVPYDIDLFPVEKGLGLPNFPNFRLGKLMKQEANAGPGKAICTGETTQIGTPDATSKMIYSWAPPDGLDFPNSAQPTASPTHTTTYYLTAIDTTICPEYGTSHDSVTVTVKSNCHIQVVPVVTPDGDGLNDHFEIKNLRPGTEVQITDYLGRRVFHSSNYQNDWPNGSLILSQGVYFYWVEDPQEGAFAGRLVVGR